MLVQIDNKNMVNPDKIVNMELTEKEIMQELINPNLPFEQTETYITKICFDHGYITCDIKLSDFVETMKKCRGIT